MRMTDWSTVSAHGRLALATFHMASCAILQAFGPDWAEKHIGRPDLACDYFKAKQDNLEEMLRHMARATEFGELIYNLHGVGGFDQRVESMKADETTGIESGIAELIAGKFFRMANVIFEYVTVKKVPGQNTPRNPDIEYVAGMNRLEACEVKCNLQSTDLNDRSIFNALKTAKGQLPKGKAGIILVRVPENWLVDMDAGTSVIGNAINNFIATQKSKRLSSVFVFVSAMKILPNDQMAQILGIREFRNTHCKQCPGITIPDLSGGAPNWYLLSDLAQRELNAVVGRRWA